MPILPIDLQTLFSQMDQVGKEQAAQKEGAALQASMQNMGQVKLAEEKDNSVNQSQQVGDGVEKLGNEEKKKREKGKGKKEAGDKNGRKKEQFEDPALGHHIDIKT